MERTNKEDEAVPKIYKLDEKSGHLAEGSLHDAVQMLQEGCLALLPTETVYGVGVAVGAYMRPGANGGSASVNGMPTPSETTGYGRIFTLKRREMTQTVPWLVDGPAALDCYGIDVDRRIRSLAEAFWPGALTLVVPASDAVPPFMRAADGTVALRASASPVIQALVKACKSPLAVTSANTHGAPAPASFEAVEGRILEGVDVAVDAGPTVCSDASTIVGVRDGRVEILRQGALPAEEIARVAV